MKIKICVLAILLALTSEVQANSDIKAKNNWHSAAVAEYTSRMIMLSTSAGAIASWVAPLIYTGILARQEAEVRAILSVPISNNGIAKVASLQTFANENIKTRDILLGVAIGATAIAGTAIILYFAVFKPRLQKAQAKATGPPPHKQSLTMLKVE